MYYLASNSYKMAKQVAAKKPPVKKVVKKKFELKPGVNYNWDVNGLMSLSGMDFKRLSNTVTFLTNTESFNKEFAKAQEVIALADLRSLISSILQQGLDDGTVTETPQEPIK